MGDQLYLERFIWFDQQARKERFPNAFKLADQFEISTKTAQRSINHFRDRLLAPLQYEPSHKGYYYTDPTCGPALQLVQMLKKGKEARAGLISSPSIP